jgi:hypothetical protein
MKQNREQGNTAVSRNIVESYGSSLLENNLRKRVRRAVPKLHICQLSKWEKYYCKHLNHSNDYVFRWLYRKKISAFYH